MKLIYLCIILIAFLSCENKKSSENISELVEPIIVIDSQKVDNTFKIIEEIEDDSIFVDTIFIKYLSDLDLNGIYSVNTKHKPFHVEGYFNDDTFIDTAMIVNHKNNHKDGLLIKYGRSSDYIILGAGSEVLGRGFDDFDWVGDFYKIDKGEKIFSNIDEKTSEIRIDEVPDSEKHTLLTDGIYIHAFESCGGGIIYFQDDKYHWVQQE
jgi:uncharacterized protein YkvS